MSIAIRLNEKGKLECLSSDGVNCIKNLTTEDQCRRIIQQNIRYRPAKCKVDQTGNKDHWCYRAYNYYFKQWHCQKDTGLSTGVSLDAYSGNVMCLSFDGKDCLWGKKAEIVCRQVSWCHKTRARLKPVICGKEYKRKSCSQGYNSPHSHWCKKAFAFFRYDGRWWNDDKNTDTMIQMNHHGDIGCISKDGKDCIWDISKKKLNPRVLIEQFEKKSIQILTCGKMMKRVKGILGYEKKKHWCNRGLEHFFKIKTGKWCNHKDKKAHVRPYPPNPKHVRKGSAGDDDDNDDDDDKLPNEDGRGYSGPEIDDTLHPHPGVVDETDLNHSHYGVTHSTYKRPKKKTTAKTTKGRSHRNEPGKRKEDRHGHERKEKRNDRDDHHNKNNRDKDHYLI